MGKHKVGLRLKDMYAIKHALQIQIRIKKRKVEDLSDTSENGCEIEVNKLTKDIKHEEWLLQSITNEIEEFKLNNSIK